MTKTILARLAAGILAFSAGAARADIALSQIIVDNGPGDSLVRDVELSNFGPDKAYVEVAVYRIANPGLYPMERETSKNPADMGLVVTPNKIVLGPDSARLIRLMLLNPPDEQEHVWRISVVPKVAEIKDGQAGVKIVVGYEMLVIQRPRELKFDLRFERKGKILTVANRGNTDVLIPALEQCAASGCQKGAGTRVYPGRTEQLALPLDMPVDVSLQAAGRNWVEHQP